jgi:RNA polymerase sigma-70 factor (ECF subfamily)
VKDLSLLSGLDEKDLVKLCQKSDRNAQEEFFKRYSRQVYNLAFRVLNHRESAEDALQEVFIKAYRFLPEFQYQSKITTWLYRITVNHCHDLQRSQSRHNHHIIRERPSEESSEPFIEQIADTQPLPDREQETRQFRQTIIEAIQRLPAEFREVIYLKEVKELSYEEISQILGCRMGTVKSRIFRAREILQIELNDLYNQIIKGDAL